MEQVGLKPASTCGICSFPCYTTLLAQTQNIIFLGKKIKSELKYKQKQRKAQSELYAMNISSSRYEQKCLQLLFYNGEKKNYMLINRRVSNKL